MWIILNTIQQYRYETIEDIIGCYSIIGCYNRMGSHNMMGCFEHLSNNNVLTLQHRYVQYQFVQEWYIMCNMMSYQIP